MHALAFDTAGLDCAAAIVHGQAGRIKVLARASERLGRGHAERLLPMIGEVLAEAGLDYGELSRIAVTIGPGSFTGVRIGVAAARGLALALGIPACGVGTLEALIQPALDRPEGTAVAVLDARRGEIYAMATDLRSGANSLPVVLATPEQVAADLSKLPEPLYLIGAGAHLLAQHLVSSKLEIVDFPECPNIADVARLGIAADPTPPMPLYLRAADARPQSAGGIGRQPALVSENLQGEPA